MDKYEYRIKVEQMNKLVARSDYATAMKIANTIDWRKVKNISTLLTVCDIYEKMNMLEECREILLLAYDRAPIGRSIVYRLAELAIKMGELDEAIDLYKEFVEVAPNDYSRFVLKYKIYKARGSSLKDQIAILEDYKRHEITEKWTYELASLHHQAGNKERCIELCNELVLWFSDGKYVLRAMELKQHYEPLTNKQLLQYNRLIEESRKESAREKAELEERERQKEQEEQQEAQTEAEKPEEKEVKKVDPDEFDKALASLTSTEPDTLEEELADHVKEIFAEEEQEHLKDLEHALEQESEHLLEMEEAEETAAVKPDFDQASTAENDTDSYLDLEKALEEGISTEYHGDSFDTYNELTMSSFNEEADLTEVPEEDFIIDFDINLDDISEPVFESEPAPLEEPVYQEEAVQPVETEYHEEESQSGYQEEMPAAAESYEPYEAPETNSEEPVSEESGAPQVSMKEVLQELEQMKKLISVLVQDTKKDVQEPAEVPNSEKADDMLSDLMDEVAVTDAEPAPKSSEIELKGFLEEIEEKLESYQEMSEENGGGQLVVGEDDPTGPDSAETEAAEETDGLEIAAETEQAEESHEPEDFFFSDEELELEEEDAEEPESNIRKFFVVERNEGSEDSDEEESETEAESEAETETVDQAVDILEEVEYGEDSEEEMLENTGVIIAPKEFQEKTEAEESAKEDEESEDLDEEEQELHNEILDSLTAFTEFSKDDPEKELTEEQKKIFTYFTSVQGMSHQIRDVLKREALEVNREGTSAVGNIVIIGEKGTGKTQLAIDLVKAIQKSKNLKSSKIAKISGAVLNKKDVFTTVEKISGGGLIIEEADEMSEQTVADLIEAMDGDTGEAIIVFEGKKKPMKQFLTIHPELEKKITSTVNIPIFTNDELVAFAKEYAMEQGYVIDDLGVLALYNRIGNALGEDKREVNIADVKEIMDNAINHVNKFGLKKMMNSLTRKRYDEDDYVILREKDFEK